MAEENRSPRFAVLIDADNTSPRIAAGLFEEVAKFGEASVRRIYGDFSGQRLRSWADILPKYAIDPHQQFAYTTGKNASDIALVIDAMDLLHSGRLDGFCLVSSDSDFTRLASRLREQGADVYGFGEQKTPESFRQACRRFIYTENLLPEAQVVAPEEGPIVRALQPPSAATPILKKPLRRWRLRTAGSGWAWSDSTSPTSLPTLTHALTVFGNSAISSGRPGHSISISRRGGPCGSGRSRRRPHHRESDQRHNHSIDGRAAVGTIASYTLDAASFTGQSLGISGSAFISSDRRTARSLGCGGWAAADISLTHQKSNSAARESGREARSAAASPAPRR
jgi:hypothetical protein